MTTTLSPATEAAIAIRDRMRATLDETRREIAAVLGTPDVHVTLTMDLPVEWATTLAADYGRWTAADDIVTACMRADMTASWADAED